MGRGSSKAGKNAGAKPLPREATEVVTSSGRTVHLDSPLIYGDQDPVFRESEHDYYIRNEIETGYEGMSVESAYYWDSYGEQVGRVRAQYADHVSIAMTRDDIESFVGFTHNHPRMEEGDEYCIGGTFSSRSGTNRGDMAIFCNTNNRNLTTMRAVAAEGTYSISKRPDFRRSMGGAYTRASNSNYSAAFQGFDEIRRSWRRGEISNDSFYRERGRRMNNWLIADHNWLLANQDKYGYTYSLERR